jgi:type IV secretory pathway TrbL component
VTDFLGQATGVVSGLVNAVSEAATSGTQASGQTETPVGYEPAAPKAATKHPRAASSSSSSSKKGATKSAAKRATPTRSKKTRTDEPGEA